MSVSAGIGGEVAESGLDRLSSGPKQSAAGDRGSAGRRKDNRRTYFGAIWASAPFIPVIAAAITVVAYTASDRTRWWRWMHDNALLVGPALALLFWVLLPLFWRHLAVAGYMNTYAYGRLRRRLKELEGHLAVLCPGEEGSNQGAEGDHHRHSGASPEGGVNKRLACTIARKHQKQIEEELDYRGLPWILGTGYIRAWNQLHRAEEALLEIRPCEDVIADALHDELRLRRSQLASDEDLLDQLRRAIRALGGPGGAAYLSKQASSITPDIEPGRDEGLIIVANGVEGPSPGLPQPPQEQDQQRGATSPGRARAALALLQRPIVISRDVRREKRVREQQEQQRRAAAESAQARAVLRHIRLSINTYRDDRREGLVRMRNHLLTAISLTGLTTYALLGLAIARAASDSAVTAATVFYGVGAVTGLFNRLHSLSRTDTAVEDYGLSMARLILTPLLSGLAAIGGVYVVAIIATLTPNTGSASPPTVSLPTLGAIYDLTRNPSGILHAAVFGLTPGLLVERLKQQAERYQADLRNTKGEVPQETAPSGRR